MVRFDVEALRRGGLGSRGRCVALVSLLVLLNILLLVACAYVRAAAAAAATRRRERSEQDQLMRETRDVLRRAGRQEAASTLRKALEAAPAPRRVYSSTSCAICLEDFAAEGAEVTTLRCGHEFHSECVAQWLPVQQRCPTCRQPVTLGRSLLEGALLVGDGEAN